jgi:hypothetical protein
MVVVMGGILVAPTILTLWVIKTVSPCMIMVRMLPALILTVFLLVFMGLMSLGFAIALFIMLRISLVK